jgi:hypothetical protein
MELRARAGGANTAASASGVPPPAARRSTSTPFFFFLNLTNTPFEAASVDEFLSCFLAFVLYHPLCLYHSSPIALYYTILCFVLLQW